METPEETPLELALREGDISRLQQLIASGEDIHFKNAEGYDALILGVHSRVVHDGPKLLEWLEFLIQQKVDLRGVTDYGESGVRVLARLGRYDGVALLLRAGADKQQLQWSPLHEATALGSLDDMRLLLAQNPDLEARDYWSMTPWHIALLLGDLEKAKLLRDHGANIEARGRCGKLPLYYPLEGGHPEIFHWLLELGIDIHAKDDFGATALMHAVGVDDLHSVNILIAAGANIESDRYGSIIGDASSREVILRLLDAGADPSNLRHENQRCLLGLGEIDPQPLDTITPQEYLAAHSQVFGKTNPEKMNFPFWIAMIRAGVAAYAAWDLFSGGDTAQRPVWCAQRFGQSITFLPDGRIIQIGGEHEDYYDRDFCIYNDVFVHHLDGSIDIYGYPESVFPPTDFHSATLVGDYIYVIGSTGYMGQRQFGKTQVCRLHIHSLQIEKLEPQGDLPGAIYGHRAALVNANEIRVWGGKVMLKEGDQENHVANPAIKILDLETLTWHAENPAKSVD